MIFKRIRFFLVLKVGDFFKEFELGTVYKFVIRFQNNTGEILLAVKYMVRRKRNDWKETIIENLYNKIKLYKIT